MLALQAWQSYERGNAWNRSIFGVSRAKLQGVLPRSRRLLTPQESRAVLGKRPIVRTLPSHWVLYALMVLAIFLTKYC